MDLPLLVRLPQDVQGHAVLDATRHVQLFGLGVDRARLSAVAEMDSQQRSVARIVKELKAALDADYVVLGGGNVKKIKTLPSKTRLGANGNAFLGGYRLWSNEKGKESFGLSGQ
jgi:hypothetical protein